MKTKFKFVKDIPDNYTLAIDSQDIRATLESIASPCNVEEMIAEYGCLFVLPGEGEILEVWGVIPSVPHLDAHVYRLDIANV